MFWKTVFRIEDENGFGPYWNPQRNPIIDAMIESHDQHPARDDFKWRLNYLLFWRDLIGMDAVFGCPSKSAMRAWFGKENIDYLLANGYKIRRFRVFRPFMQKGKSKCQVAFIHPRREYKGLIA